MAKLDVMSLGKKGVKKGGSVELSPVVFETPLRPHLLHAEVRRQLAARRRGTHATKNRHAVSGGGAKPWRQKGTGRARQGSTRAPQWEGGGVVFGPVPRSHAHALPKKVRRAAMRSALSQRLREGAITIVDELACDEFKTRRMVEILNALSLGGQGLLIVTHEKNPFVEGSAHNLPGVSLLRAEGLNVYDVLRHPKLLITRGAIEAIEKRLGDSKAAKRPRSEAQPSEGGLSPGKAAKRPRSEAASPKGARAEGSRGRPLQEGTKA